jgi:hypothetical protein
MNRILGLLLTSVLAFSACKTEVVTPSKSSIVGWGDDFTYGIPGKDTTYLTELARLTGVQTYNLGFLEKSSTQIKNRMVADTTLHRYPTIIWISRDILSNATIKADIADMVAALGHNNYLVLGLVNDHRGHEEKGDVRYNNIVKLNQELADLYGEHFMDIRTLLIAQYDQNNPQDVKDHALDVLPESLRDGYTNLNNRAFTFIAGQINTKIQILRGDADAPTN